VPEQLGQLKTNLVSGESTIPSPPDNFGLQTSASASSPPRSIYATEAIAGHVMKTSFLSTAFAIATLLIVSVPFAWGQAQPTTGQPTTGSQTPEQAARSQKAADAILKAISVLVPGGLDEGTPRRQKFAAGIELFRQGKILQSRDEFRDLALIDPELPPAEIVMAGITFAIGDNKTGLSQLESAGLLHPNYPGVYLSLAQVALNQGRITDAAVHMEKTASLLASENLTDAQKKHFQKQYYEILTGVYFRRGQDKLAEQTLEQLQTLDPNAAFYLYSKAELAFKKELPDEALKFLKQHAEATKSKSLPEITLIDWFDSTGKKSEAESLLLDTLKKNPGDAQIQLIAAQMFMSKEDFPKAMVALDKFESFRGPTIASIDMKGRIAFAGQAYELAEKSFEELLKRNPNDANFQNVYALCLIESDDPEKQETAKKVSEQVVRRLPKNPLARGALGYVYLKLGEVEQAQRALGQLVLSQNNSPEISYFVANWLKGTGQKEEAAKVLNLALESKSLFLYRSASRKLLQEINTSK
jgi:predicted Zn-dependent protease